ncbi:MAG: Mfa1 fimbrilin C-terminal domain-containing protein [Muribaculaceae bacterium]|nr:Mfa1 fimbrilin C-terminal domain-containing protein [Muribaculaceae bacterium]
MEIDKTLYSKGKSILTKKQGVKATLFAMSFLFSALFAPSCTDDLISPDSGTQGPDGNLATLNLPGVMGIGISTDLDVKTRAPQNASPEFHDGDESEYDLSSPDGNGENYNYLLLFKSTVNNGRPLIFPIDQTWEKLYDETSSTNNLTLTISKVFVNQIDGDVSGSSLKMPDLHTSLTEWKSFLSGMTAYVVLNFRLYDSGYGVDGTLPNYVTSEGGLLPGNNTVEKLSRLSETQFKDLYLRDYKVRGIKNVTSDGESTTSSKDFFIMSNSVYAVSSSEVVGVPIDSSKIFDNVEDAISQPCLEVYLERLASKVSVQFDLGKLNSAEFDPYGHQQKIRGVYFDDTNKGLPVFLMEVEQVDMTNGTGITFDATNGYNINRKKVNATIRVLGFGLSNTEPKSYLFKDINPSLSSDAAGWQWNDPINHRSYWARAPHYQLEKPLGDVFFANAKAKGYLHQFRLALDSDSVVSYHSGIVGGYNYSGNPEEVYYINNTSYTSYNQLGEIVLDKTIDQQGADVFLRYKSFNELLNDFDNIQAIKAPTTGRFTYSPLYSLENTYYDPGTLLGPSGWIWPWNREPYATATNLILLAEIEIDDNTSGDNTGSSSSDSEGDTVGFSTRETDGLSSADTRNNPRTVYLGQNNIFYLKLENLLKSKLAILNQVMLEGGNAGIQILHGQWDRHTRWEEGDGHVGDDSHLDKVAWNEGSKLWFAEVEWEEDNNGNPTNVVKREPILDANGSPVVDEDGNPLYRVSLSQQFLLPTSDDIIRFLDLIPAEISGGDGQRLIAPHQNFMGKDFRYYLAPIKAGSSENNPEMDRDMAVEISFNHLVALIHKIIGPVDVYTNGKMYFSVPLPHRALEYGPNRGVNSWKQFGTFGQVRNNWYNVTIDAITRMGTPVDVPSQPIIPVMDVKRSYINMGVSVKEWHDIVQDNVPMM